MVHNYVDRNGDIWTWDENDPRIMEYADGCGTLAGVLMHRGPLRLLSDYEHMNSPEGFAVGQRVDKISGYRFPGTIIGISRKLDGQYRYDVELDELGLIHIFSAKDLKRI